MTSIFCHSRPGVQFRSSLALALAFALSQSPAPAQQMKQRSISDTVLQVAGDYPTDVSLLADSCGGSIVRSMPTSVTHRPGDSTLTLLHAGSVYAGKVMQNGTFQTVPGKPLVFNEFSYIVTVSGKFTSNGFRAVATVERTTIGQSTAPCRYSAQWVGTRTTGTNVIPKS